MMDVIVTTYNRLSFLKQTIESFIEMNKEMPYRLFISDDCSTDGTADYLCKLRTQGVANILLPSHRQGVVYGFNFLWNWVDYLDTFDIEYPFMCYLQDDMVSTKKEWLVELVQVYEALKEKEPIGFFSGYDAPEHLVKETVQYNGCKVFLKTSTGGSNLIAEKDFWRSIGFVPKRNPDGSVRGYPNKNVGSHIDVYLTGYYSLSRINPGSSAKNCLRYQNKKVMVVPSLMHLGQEPKESTWRTRR